MLWAHNGGGERAACTHMSVPCRGEVCWVYAMFETVMGWSRELIGWLISIWEFHSVSGVFLRGGASAAGHGPVRSLARYFVYEGMAILHLVHCSASLAERVESLPLASLAGCRWWFASPCWS
jgi:hypothetical protein